MTPHRCFAFETLQSSEFYFDLLSKKLASPFCGTQVCVCLIRATSTLSKLQEVSYPKDTSKFTLRQQSEQSNRFKCSSCLHHSFLHQPSIFFSCSESVLFHIELIIITYQNIWSRHLFYQRQLSVNNATLFPQNNLQTTKKKMSLKWHWIDIWKKVYFE
jgi:hypothetical protein